MKKYQMLAAGVGFLGMAAAVLAFDPGRRTVLLVKQMRIAAYMAGYAGGGRPQIPAQPLLG